MDNFANIVIDRLNSIEGKLDTVVGRVTKLELKSSLWGMLGGAVTAILWLILR